MPPKPMRNNANEKDNCVRVIKCHFEHFKTELFFLMSEIYSIVVKAIKENENKSMETFFLILFV